MKNMKLIGFIVLVTILIVGGFVMYKPGDEVSMSVEENSGDYMAILESVSKSDVPSSVELIDAALAEGKITEDEAALNKMYALFDRDSVADEFKSDTMIFTGNYDLMKIREKMPELSEETQAQLAPFFKRPDDPESYWNLKYNDNLTEENQENALLPTAHANRASIYTEFLVSADDKVKIWYPSVDMTANQIFGEWSGTVNAAGAKAMAQKIKGYLDNDKIVERFEILMGRSLISDGTAGGDGRLDIYISPTEGSWGLTYGPNTLPGSSYILLLNTMSDDRILKTTLAHELFHSFQYVFDYNWQKDLWYAEATAVWSEDFIYPTVNSEQRWLDLFMFHPEVTVYALSPPSNHHYAAYIFPYFITENFGDEMIRSSWEKCEEGLCIDGLDGLLSGGLKKQWREFTLWNYNASPVLFYTDNGKFPEDSSGDSDTTEYIHAKERETEVKVAEIAPLSADLARVYNKLPENTDIKRMVFMDLDKFTEKSEKAAIMAIIYYQDGTSSIEDWTDKKRRSFCIENQEENFKQVVLIFSNADIKKSIPETTVMVEGKDTCYHIDQEDQTDAVLHMPYGSEAGIINVDIPNTITTVSYGEPQEMNFDDANYGYQVPWKLNYEFEQVRDAFSFPCMGSTIDYMPGWISRNAGYLSFNLDPDNVAEDGTFSVDLSYGLPHPHGNYEVVPDLSVACAGIMFASTKIDMSQFQGTMKDMYRGKILEKNKDGALLEFENTCIYSSCTDMRGAPFQDFAKNFQIKIKKVSDKET